MTKFTKSFFIGNRERLSNAINGAVVFIPANSLLQSSADLAFPFRQDSSFWYLCGIDEPDAVLVIDTTKKTSKLLLPKQSDFHDEWDGAHDKQRIQQKSGVDTVQIVEMGPTIAQIASDAVKNGVKVGFMKPLDTRVEPYGFYSNPSRRVFYDTLVETLGSDDVLIDVRVPVAKLRQIKQQCEIDAIRQAINVTAEGLQDVKAQIASYRNEKDIERALSSHFYGKADGHAYEPIVARGHNAATIHYTGNNQPLDDQGLLLLDVGAQHDRYAADISRTWALSKPTQRHKDLHAHVLDVQHYAMSLLKPGILLREYQKDVELYNNKKIQKLGIHAEAYPHGVSHFLGLDVHDAGDYSSPLTEGTVLTVEPGVYLAGEGIGIHIEDDVLITKDGVENLSAQIPTDL